MYIIMCAAVVQPYKFVEITVAHYYRVLYILWTTLQRCYMDTSLPRGPGQVQEKIRGSAHMGFLLSLAAKGWMEKVISGWRKHCMASAPVKRVAWGRYLCLARDSRGRWRFRLGTKITVWRPGWGPRERTPAIAASVAISVRSWPERNPQAMQTPFVNVRNAATKWSGCGIG